MPSPWAFGNTTVRNPLRIRSGLIALKGSTLNGHLIGKEQELKFAELLDAVNVVEIRDHSRDYSDMGRKWRSCFSQLGFITHKFSRNTGLGEVEELILQAKEHIENCTLSGLPFEVTPSGGRLINAESFPEQQECFLRALLAYEIPSAIETNNGSEPFMPLFFVLQVLKELLSRTDQGLSYVEMGILQAFRTHDQNEIINIVNTISEYRVAYNGANGTVAKRAVDRETLTKFTQPMGIQFESLKDYADLNFRYLRYTGLFSFKGRRLIFNPDKQSIVDAILLQGVNLISDQDEQYLATLWSGAILPTDNETNALSEIEKYKHLLINEGISETSLPALPPNATVADMNMLRLRFEEMHHEQLELQYASLQAQEPYLSEIITYLKKLDNQRDEDTSNLETIDDKAAYLEWAVWRAFLAIDSLVNPAYEARRFKVDQDFYPVGCAPGKGPDMIFVFDDFALVVEVTLTSSSRQEASEGEPVRRHVAVEKERIARESGKPVYGLFLAGTIDNNTAETFRIGVWYNDDTPEFINIIPLTLRQFVQIMDLFRRKAFSVSGLRQLLDCCLIPRNAHAPAWKKEIAKSVEKFISQ
ncbi:MAG: AlwI family type II restriction endonuclease [Eubacteriales bacterium]|nr:AlwI family type II restriction endonuclease [Eubacteriales bacterium]